MASTAITTLTTANFNEVLGKDGIVFIDWWAPWCGPCRAFSPIYEKVAAKNTDITFAKINTEDQPELAGKFGIQSIPTLMIFRDRILLFAQPGMLPEAALDDLVNQGKALNMDEVRAEMEKQKTQQEKDRERIFD